MAAIVICVMIFNIGNFILEFMAFPAFIILMIAGVIYAVGYAFGETWKYRNEVEKEELTEVEEND